MNLQHKVVVITGGGSGIGAATAKIFCKEFAKVAIVGRNEMKLRSVAEQCSAIGSKPLTITADLAKDNEAVNVIHRTIKEYRRIDILINNAATVKTDRILDEDFMEKFDEVMKINMRAVVVLTQTVIPHLIKSKGNIINISSIAGMDVCCSQYTSYSISKAALNHFTKCLAVELAPVGVRVNSISPGPVRTGIMVSAGIQGNIEDSAITTALGKLADAEEVAELIMYLCSDKAISITGTCCVIDNGKLLN